MAKKPTPQVAAVSAFKKDYTALKNYLLGRGFYLALEGMAFAEKYHTGTRKDGYTPEFHHQLIIAWTIINLRGLDGDWRSDRGLTLEEHCILLAFLHDVMEDYNLSLEEIAKDFGKMAADDVYALSKKHRGEVKTVEQYNDELAEQPQRIIVKGSDNSHNVQSMHGAFKPEKIASYLLDSKTHKLPLLKLGRKRFPKYHFAFTGLSFMLKRQIELYEAHTAAMAGEQKKHTAAVREAILTRDRASSSALEQKVALMDSANRAINADLEHARQQLDTYRTRTQQQMEFDKSNYNNFAKAIGAIVARMPLDVAALFYKNLEQEAARPGKSFPMPSMLAHVDSKHANFDGLAGAAVQR
jgi:hypothetical protein